MTISSQICKRIYQADGENRRWSIDFPYLSAAELKIYCTNASGVESDVSSQCVLDAAEHEIIYPTLASGQEPLAAGYKLTIIRTTTPTQTLHLTQQGTLDAAALEHGFDKLTLHVQELAEQVGRSIKYPVSSNKTNADAQTFLTELQTAHTALLTSALESVEETETALMQAVSEEASARVQADTDLQTALTAKQNALSADQQYAVNSGVTSAKVSGYDAHLLNTNNPHSVTKAQVGLGNVDNTADEDKPISTATQSALNAKQNTLTTVQQAAVDSGVTSATVAQVQTNKENIAMIEAELEENREWQKPADWMDIRSGSLPNSIYFLVGHSSDYSTYPIFAYNFTIESSGTYDVYVDGIKQATTASGTETTLNWQTLALTSGYDVTTPENLRTHIVRVTPTDATKKITRIYIPSTHSNMEGLLWVHFNIDYAIAIQAGFGSTTDYQYLLQAITARNNEIKVLRMGTAFARLSAICTLPVIDCANMSVQELTYAFYQTGTNLKKVHIKNLQQTGYANNPQVFTGTSIEEIIFENSAVCWYSTMFQQGNSKLKHIPEGLYHTSDNAGLEFRGDYTSLQDTFIDLSQRTGLTRLRLEASSNAKNLGIKGVVVSNQAPFSNATAPQINVSYTGLDKAALVNLFNSMPTVTDSQVCNITGTTGAADLTSTDLAIATDKGWTITR